jgi:hypothetical protein
VSWCAKGGADATADVRNILGNLAYRSGVLSGLMTRS